MSKGVSSLDLTSRTKECARCRMRKKVTKFSIQIANGKRRLHSYCRPCLRAYHVGKSFTTLEQRREYHREYAKRRSAEDAGFKRRTKHYRRLDKVGITREQYAALVKSGGAVCAICGAPPLNGRTLCIDHDHKTLALRGLLCQACNAGLGQFKDDPERMIVAAAYLRKHRDTPSAEKVRRRVAS